MSSSGLSGGGERRQKDWAGVLLKLDDTCMTHVYDVAFGYISRTMVSVILASTTFVHD
jgi:hypothetical protein